MIREPHNMLKWQYPPQRVQEPSKIDDLQVSDVSFLTQKHVQIKKDMFR